MGTCRAIYIILIKAEEFSDGLIKLPFHLMFSQEYLVIVLTTTMFNINERFDSDWVETASLTENVELKMRRLIPSDKDRVRNFFSELSSVSRYSRYFKHKEHLTEDELQDCLTSDADENFVIGAWESDESGVEKGLVGTASYIRLNDKQESAEFAIVVSDEWQERGVGKYLTRAVISCAKEAGVNRILVYFLPSNAGMKRLAESMAEKVSFKFDEGVVVADIDLVKDEVVTLYWPGEFTDIWDTITQSVIDMSMMPFAIYMDLSEDHVGMMKTISEYDHISDFENLLDSI